MTIAAADTLTPREQELLDAALAYREAGWSVIPIRPDGRKKAAVEWTEYQSRLPSREEVTNWWTGLYKGHNIAAITGRIGGVWVVDCDNKPNRNGADNLLQLAQQYGKLPSTLRSVTGGQGVHLFFDYDLFSDKIPNSKSAIADAVDVRGDGGYAVVPPSSHPSGNNYCWYKDTPFGEYDAAEAPDWLSDMARTAKAESQRIERTVSPDDDFSSFGLRQDGREQYMADTVWAIANDLHRKTGQAPTPDEIFDAAWPQYEKNVKARGADLETDGRGETEMRNKCVSTAKKLQREAGPVETPAKNEIFEQWKPIAASDIAPRRWLYGRDYIRKFLTATVAPGGLGKSTLVLAEAIAMASGTPVLGVLPEGGRVKESQLRVGYFNAEDPMDEIQRRVLATCQQYFVSQAALADRLWLASGRDHRQMVLMTGDDGIINEDAFDFLQGFAISNDLDVLIFDPLANMTTSPETNDVFRLLTARLNTLAGNTDTAVHIVHHTRKLQPGMAATDNDARGGRALVDGARSVRVLNHMSAEEAARAGLESHIDHFRSEDAKANLSRRSERASWYARIGVKLENGDNVATVEPWQWPAAFDGVPESDLLKVQQAIERSERPARRSPQARDWAGNIVGDVLGLNMSDQSVRARVRVMLETWIKNHAFKIDEIKDTEKGRNTPILLVDNWADAE